MAEQCDQEGATEDEKRTCLKGIIEGSCPICLHIFDQVVILPTCLHMFCFNCIQEWYSHLESYGVSKPTCPLCKTVFEIGITNVVSEKIYRLHDFSCKQQLYSVEEEFRKSIYSLRLKVHCVHQKPCALEQIPVRYKSLASMQPWIERELRVCCGKEEDIAIPLRVVLSILEPNDLHLPIKYKMALEELVPYLFENTDIFLWELVQYSACKIYLPIYDQDLKYVNADR